jgi:hypothetical protein
MFLEDGFQGLSTLFAAFTVLYKDIYINLVVVVNGDFFVDKSFFTNRLNGLRRLQVGRKALYPVGIVVG